MVLGSCLLSGCAPSPNGGQADRGHATHNSVPEVPAEQPATVDSSVDSSTTVAESASIPAPFVGSARCAECHEQRAASFAQTDHSRSLRVAVAAEEPELSNLFHSPSSQRFAVKRVGDQLYHRGWQTLSDTDQELLLCDAGIEYVMGSGAWGKSYLFRDGPVWLQSPLGFYVAKDKYDMSPGYDRPYHQGFTRQVTDQCMFCHAGIVSRNRGNQNDFNVHELAIGCERCHGPGQRHADVAETRSTRHPSAGHAEAGSDPDWQIVHPANLNRDELESICAQCHLQGDIVLYVDQQHAWSFQPGEDLGRRKMIYNVSRPAEEATSSIKFVGHFEQLRQSVCYQQSESLTCVTCHDPHGSAEAEPEDQIWRSHCLSCHDNQHCSVPLGQRQQTNENRCWSCHMPRQESDVPHVAVVNHLIGIYPDEDAAVYDDKSGDRPKPSRLPVVSALLDRSPEDSWQRRLNEEVALATWLLRGTDPDYHTLPWLTRAVGRLRDAIADVPATDAQADAFASSPYPVVSRNTATIRLADLLDQKLSMEKDRLSKTQIQKTRTEILALVGSVLQTSDGPTSEYESSLAMLALFSYELRDFSAAYRLYNELTTLRQRSADFYNLGLACDRLGRYPEAEQAFLRAIRIQGDYPKPMASLGRLYHSIDPERARQYFKTAEQLSNTRVPGGAD